ncbi:hypothetical protein F5880DRAFT_1512742, partial [Lentinula raphanica]
MSKKRGFEDIFETEVRGRRKLRNLQSLTPSITHTSGENSESGGSTPSHPPASQHVIAHLPPLSVSLASSTLDNSRILEHSNHQPSISPTSSTAATGVPPSVTTHHLEFAGSKSGSSLPVATALSQSSQSHLVENTDYGLTVMASTMLNRDIDFSQPAGTITLADLDELADLVQDATTMNLSSTFDPLEIRKILLDAEQAVVIVKADLAKRRRKELQAEVDDAKSVVRSVEELLKTWRALHPDMSPVRLNNSEVAANPMLSHPTSTLIAFSMAFVGRVMEGLGRRGTNFLLKTARLFGHSLTYLQPGGPNYQQQAALSSIPDDIRGLEQKFKLDVETTVFA